MKALFLTSSLGGYVKTIKNNEVIKEITKCNNSNQFVDRLKAAAPQIKTFAFVASNPDGAAKTDEYAQNTVKSLNMDGFGIENLIIIDHRFNGDIAQAINSADVVFLAGGNVPMQNNYFKEINLKSILSGFGGIIIGQSAGSMNCSTTVYTQPEEDEEFEDKNYQRTLHGLGLTDITVMPHMNFANITDDKGHPSVIEMCLKDSFTIPHYGICDYGFVEIINGSATAYGKTFLIKNGKCTQICADQSCTKLSPITPPVPEK